ncbi:hypothetical protein [Streptomyces sp. DT18]
MSLPDASSVPPQDPEAALEASLSLVAGRRGVPMLVSLREAGRRHPRP